ncbi:MAG: 3-deoxy-D-manno-octulosonic acid transferase, partial [Bacteroidia bacterium]|nr:3-deoxy-D-manno-octulosonic acid transferase [Bacteroidia bacterium]
VFFRKQLNKAHHYFVQNQTSLQLLYKNKITQVSVSGDTRFDRVYQNLNNNNNIAGITDFKNGKNILLGGSTWPAEEKMLIELANSNFLDYKYIIAPHEISQKKIESLQKKLTVKSIKYSEIDGQNLSDINVLIMDNVGYLSSLYKYAKISVIGGGFGKGIHNILESAVFGAPTIFGPHYKKSKEAVDLVKREKAFSVKNLTDLQNILRELEENELIYEEVSEVNKNYIMENKGATSIIINQIKMDLGKH